jgi:hypothetical protein
MQELMADIERALPIGGDWCTLERAQTLASLVVALRPRLVVEVGVWAGGSAIPMMLALRWNAQCAQFKDRLGRFVAIDPWRAAASVAGQSGVNAQWWNNPANHERAYQVFLERVKRHELGNLCETIRAASDDVTPPDFIDLLSVDGNHGEQAIRDVDRYAPKVPIGGILALDDVDWKDPTTGACDVQTAHEHALALGFVDLYRLGFGVIMQRVKP